MRRRDVGWWRTVFVLVWGFEVGDDVCGCLGVWGGGGGAAVGTLAGALGGEAGGEDVGSVGWGERGG